MKRVYTQLFVSNMMQICEFIPLTVYPEEVTTIRRLQLVNLKI